MNSVSDWRVGFVGAGRVASALAKAFAASGIQVLAAASRSPASAASLAAALPGCSACSLAEIGIGAKVIFLTVPDDSIASVAGLVDWQPGSVAIHCSGSLDLDVLDPATRRGALAGSFHPMQSFPHASLPVALSPGITVSLEAEGELLGQLEELARLIGARPLRLPPGARPLYHASGYFASPFLVTMLAQAASIWSAMGLDESAALATLLPLLKETVRMVEQHGLADSLTGVVIRRDAGTIARHLERLSAHAPEVARHYAYLTAASVEMARNTGRLTSEQAEVLLNTLKQIEPV